MNNYKKYLFLITLSYFTLAFINIQFAFLGLFCMIIPIIILIKTKKNTWCRAYCPRASLFTQCGKITKNCSLKTPKFFIKGNMRWIIFAYMGISLLFIIISTLKVGIFGVMPLYQLKFLMVLPIPIELPQLIEISNIPYWITHLSYRIYSLMLTSTILGLIFALIYKPRTWCTVCPIATVSKLYMKNN